jgi:hypothetical protein
VQYGELSTELARGGHHVPAREGPVPYLLEDASVRESTDGPLPLLSALVVLKDTGRSATSSSWPGARRTPPGGVRLDEEQAPAARYARPRSDHFAPLFVTLGAAHEELAAQRTVIDGFWHGMAKRSVRIG